MTKAKKKGSEDETLLLTQTGTLDSSYVGRKNLAKNTTGPQHLLSPTVIMPSRVKIIRVAASCSAAHAIAIDVNHVAYGWGRNEQLQLGNLLKGEGGAEKSKSPPRSVPLPRVVASDVRMAAVGKSHTIFISSSTGQLSAYGHNKLGQCGWRESTQSLTTNATQPKPCLVSPDPSTTFAQVACGEDFSLALSTDGRLFSTGSSQFGKLGKGDPGEQLQKR